MPANAKAALLPDVYAQTRAVSRVAVESHARGHDVVYATMQAPESNLPFVSGGGLVLAGAPGQFSAHGTNGRVPTRTLDLHRDPVVSIAQRSNAQRARSVARRYADHARVLAIASAGLDAIRNTPPPASIS